MYCINEKEYFNDSKTTKARIMFDCQMKAHWGNVYKDGKLVFQTPYLDSQADVETMIYSKFGF